MKLFSKSLSLSIAGVILIVLSLVTVSIGVFYWVNFDSIPPKLSALLGGLIAGLFVALLQFVWSWYEFRQIQFVRQLNIKNILPNRDNREFYNRLIKQSRSRIYVLGVTANRFLEHFANKDSGRGDARSLLEALGRGVEVRILIPKKEFLLSPEDVRKAATSEARLAELKLGHQTFQYAYFAHIPVHSIVIVDEECIVGPVFPGVDSKDTPSIYAESSSKFVEKYLTYFEQEWTKCLGSVAN